MVLSALYRSPLFMSAVLPHQVFPPLFNRYDAGMTFGAHVDNAIRSHPIIPVRIRTDVSATLFISAPEDYDGGELVVEDTYGSHEVKLPAGDLIIYPATSLHNVTPITRGSRIASFFWTQSLIRDVSASARCCSISTCRSSRSRGITPITRRWCRSRPSITTCCGNGPKRSRRTALQNAEAPGSLRGLRF